MQVTKHYLKYKKVFLISSAFLLFAGCAETNINIDKQQNEEVQKYTKQVSLESMQQSQIERYLSRIVDASFYKTPVSSAIERVGSILGIKVNRGFIPSSTYKITVNFNGTLESFLDYIYKETGVKYKIRNNALVVENKELVEQAFQRAQCPVDSKLTISIRKSSIPDILKYFSDNYGYSFFYNLKFSQKKEIGKDKTQNFYYRGCDPEEALKMFLKNNDLTCKRINKNKYEIRDYQIANITMPVYFNYDFTSGSGLGVSSYGSKVSSKEDFIRNFTRKIKSVLSLKGFVSISHRGYITIIDKPSRVAAAKKIISKEAMLQTPLAIKIYIVRVDLSNKVNAGIHLNALSHSTVNGRGTAGFQYRPNGGLPISPSSGSGAVVTGITPARTVEDMLTPIADGKFTMSVFSRGVPQIVSFLQQYGNAKIVREFRSNTRGGLLNTFKAVDQIPYITTTTTNNGGTSQTDAQAKYAEAGIIINILPSLETDGETVDLSTDIVVSEYLGDKKFSVNGDFTLPEIATNEISMPGRLHVGNSVVLTGFKLRSHSKQKDGLPGLSQNNYLGWLFGNHSKEDKVANFIIVISVKKIRDI